MVSDDDMASGSMDHVDRDDDYRLILLTAKCVDNIFGEIKLPQQR